MKRDPEEEQIIKYLLNQLSPAEQSDMEDRFLPDGELFELVCAVEDDLIEDYLAGNLSAVVRHQFEQVYRASSGRFKRLTVAADLREALKLQLPDLKRQEKEALNSRMYSDRAAAPYSFVLFPGLARDADEEPQVVTVQDVERDAVVLELELNSGGEFETYEARLKSPQGDTVLTKDGFRATPADSGWRVRVQLPAGTVPPGDYVATLYGTTAGEAELIDRYYFRVTESEEPGTGSSL